MELPSRWLRSLRIPCGALAPCACSHSNADLPRACSPGVLKPKDKHSLPPRDTSGVDHIVVVMMENRSFDHFLGWHPDRRRHAGRAHLSGSPRTATSRTRRISSRPRLHGLRPPRSRPLAGKADASQYNGGAMDGFLRAGDERRVRDRLLRRGRPAVPQRARAQLHAPSTASSARSSADTFPNRFFQHAAQTDRLENTLELSTLPTIWDRLTRRVSARATTSPTSRSCGSGARSTCRSRARTTQFLDDAAAGTLPSVVVRRAALHRRGAPAPRETIIRTPTSARAMRSSPRSSMRSPSGPTGSTTVFIVTYDEWGGFFDHVAPPRAVAPERRRPRHRRR